MNICYIPAGKLSTYIVTFQQAFEECFISSTEGLFFEAVNQRLELSKLSIKEKRALVDQNQQRLLAADAKSNNLKEHHQTNNNVSVSL